MQSKAKTVSAYLEEVPLDRRPALLRLRELCVQTLTGFEERMAYGMPGYARNGVVEVAFASQKQYISLYILRQDAMAACREGLAGLELGKGCIRYPKPERIDLGVVRQLLVATMKSKGAVC